jgi:two-component system sensor histidine kinase/response regulator
MKTPERARGVDAETQSRIPIGGQYESSSTGSGSQAIPDDGFPPPARILIVDDDGDQVDTSCRLLRANGYLAAGATSGARALDTLRTALADGIRFDIVIIDLMMPVMDGISFLRAAREIDTDIESIVMTGYGTIDTAVEAMKCGAVDYILKPFNLQVVMTVLLRAVKLRDMNKANALLLQELSKRSAELESTNRELSAANAELDAYSCSVSHDLRQPISHIIGFAELLSGGKSGPLNEKQREFFEYIYNGGKHLMYLTEELLRLARLSHEPLNKEDVDVEALVREILRPMQMAETHFKIDVRIGSLPHARADRLLLRQVFVNLLSNAFKFTKYVENPTVELTGESGLEKTTYRVCDNGAGFDMENAQRLFTVFQRFHDDGEFEGKGVGLSIVRRILERHGGSISAESTVGIGTAFTLVIPV